MQYLGMVKVRDNIDIPPKLETLKTTAYLLALPTSKQLCLIAGNRPGNGGQARAYESVCKALDSYNLHLREYNECTHRKEKLDAKQNEIHAKLIDEWARSSTTDTKLKEKEKQLVQWNSRCREIRVTLHDGPPEHEASTLKAELTQVEADIASGNDTVKTLRHEQEKIGPAISGLITDMDINQNNNRLAESVLIASRSALNDDIKQLDEQLAKAIPLGSGNAGVFTALRNGLRDTETLRGLRTDWRYWEMLGVSPAEYDDVAANSTPIQAWLDLRFSAKEALSFKNAGFTDPTKMTYLRGTGVTGPIARQMHAFGYTRDFFPQEVDEKGHQVSAATYGFTLGMHHDAWAENDAVMIGAGALNVPMGGYYKDTTAGAALMQVFKKERFVTVNATDPTDNQRISLQPGQEYATPATPMLPALQNNKLVSTEDLHAPRIGLRNVLASNLAQALGLSVIVRTEFSARSVPLTAKEIGPESKGTAPAETFSFGISMQAVEGVYGDVNGMDVIPADPETRITMIEELIDLALFDAVIGQSDRHCGNIMVDKNGHVFGIDNDQCFPDTNANNPVALTFDYDGPDTGKRGVLLPSIITKTQRAKWLAIEEKTVVKALRMATPRQRDAAIARFRVVQAHIRHLSEEQVIERSALLSDFAQKKLLTKVEFVSSDGSIGTANASYFAKYRQ